MNLTYRSVTEADFEFLFGVHQAAMQGYVEAAFGPWEEPWQREYFRAHFDPQVLRVIQVDGEDVGMLYIQQRTEELFLVDLEILPEQQRRGIGTAVVRALQAEADRRGIPVALQVLKVNPGAQKLYRRLGFEVTGENDTHYLMAYERKPGNPRSG
jgi:ribosomal protein S18 acetylase RimI-like enzyme